MSVRFNKKKLRLSSACQLDFCLGMCPPDAIRGGAGPSRCHLGPMWLWDGFGEALRRLGEAFGASELILGGFGRLWETLGEPLGRLWEALGELWETLGESLGSLWEALGSFGEVFKAFLLLTPSFPPLYIKKNQTPDQPL